MANSFVGLVAWVWHVRVMLAGVAAAVTIVSAGLLLLESPKFVGRVTILPGSQAETPNLLGQVASFAGLSLGGDDSLAQLYGQIVRADRFLQAAIDRDWPRSGEAEGVSLYEALGIADDRSEAGPREHEKLLRTLREDVVGFFRDERTDYMVLSVTVPHDRQLAADLANFLAERLDEFDRSVRQQRATEHLEFVRGRLVEVEANLDAAAAALTDFLTENRGYAASPTLLQRYGELEREVSAQTSIWIELRRQAELAEIDRHKKSGVFTILDQATPPLRKSSPKLATSLAIGVVLGLFAAFVVAGILHLRRSVLVLAGSRRAGDGG